MKEYRLADIFDIQIGKTPNRSKNEYWGNGSSWLSIRDLNNLEDNKYIVDSKEEITNSAISESNIKIVPPKTLLYSFKLSIGKVAITKFPIYTNEAIAALLPRKKSPIDIDIDYVFYLLKSKDVSSLTHDAAKGKSLNKKKLEGLTIHLPSLEEQKRKSNILNQIQSLINKRKETIKLLSEYIKSSFLQMFGDPILNLRKIKKSQGKDFEFINGHAFKSADFCETGIPLIKINQVNTKDIDSTNLSFLPSNFIEQYDSYIIKNQDLIFSLTGTYGRRDYADVSIVKSNKFDSFLLNQRVAKINYNNKKYNKYFLYQLFKIPGIKDFISNTSRGVKLVNLSTKKINQLRFIKPSMKEQNRFSYLFQLIENQKEQNEKSLLLLDELFQSALYQTFNNFKVTVEDEIDKFINDELEIDILLTDIKNTELFETFTQYDISKRKLFEVLDRTELKIKKAKELKKEFTKGLIQTLKKGKIELDYNQPFKKIN